MPDCERLNARASDDQAADGEPSNGESADRQSTDCRRANCEPRRWMPLRVHDAWACRPSRFSPYPSLASIYRGDICTYELLKLPRPGGCERKLVSSAYGPEFSRGRPVAASPTRTFRLANPLESAKSSRFPADQMAKCGRFARHDPTHACCDFGGVDSLLDVARRDPVRERAAIPHNYPTARAPHAHSTQSWFARILVDQRDTDSEGSQLHPQIRRPALPVLGG